MKIMEVSMRETLKPRIYTRFTHCGKMLFVSHLSIFASQQERNNWLRAQDYCDRVNKLNFLGGN